VLPEYGIGSDVALHRLATMLTRYGLDLSHPHATAHLQPPPLAVAVAADALATAGNASLDTYDSGPATLAVEGWVVDVLTRMAGLGGDAGGVFTPGGSMSNLLALLLARVLLSGENPAAPADHSCPFREVIFCLVARFHSHIVPSLPPSARRLPFGENTREGRVYSSPNSEGTCSRLDKTPPLHQPSPNQTDNHLATHSLRYISSHSIGQFLCPFSCPRLSTAHSQSASVSLFCVATEAITALTLTRPYFPSR